MEIFVDPFVFAVPKDPSRETMEQYLHSLASWGHAFVEFDGHCFTSELAVCEMSANSEYPTQNVVNDLIRKHGITGVSAADVINAVSRVAGRRPYIEDRCRIRDVVPEGNIDVIPDAFVSRLTPAVATAFVNSLLCVCVCDAGVFNKAEMLIGTRAHLESVDNNQRMEQSTSLVMSGRIGMYAMDDGRVIAEAVEVHDEFAVILGLTRDDADEEDWTALYLDPARATRHAFERTVSKNLSGSTLAAVTTGEQFCDSIRQLGLHNQPGVLRKVFVLSALAASNHLHEISGADLHWVRTSMARDAPQVSRDDGGKLWRCSITKRGAGFRLQYWTLLSGAIELQKVTIESKV